MQQRVTRLISTFAIALGSLSVTHAADTWTTYQGNAAHNGYVPTTLDTNNFALRWQKTIGSGLTLNPVTAADGKVFVSELGYFNNAGLYVIDAATGNPLWNVNYGPVFSVNPPAYAYGNVYVQTGNHSSDTYLRAYNANTGALVFRSAHDAQWERYYAPTIFDNKVYVNGGAYGGMYAFDAISGERLWFAGLPQYDQWTPAVDTERAYSYVGSYTPGLYAINRLTGVQEFMIPDPGFQWSGWSMDQAVALGGANNAFGINGGRLISFNLQTHAINWTLPGNFAGQAAVAKGVIYAIAAGRLVALDELTGATLWNWEDPVASLTGTLLVTDTHIITRTQTTTYAISLSTHLATWSYPVSGDLALNDGTLYVAGTNGLLTAISAPPIVPTADVAATVVESADPAKQKKRLTYTATVKNIGPEAATETTLEATLPQGVLFVSASPGCSVTGNTVTCALGSLAKDTSRVVAITVYPKKHGKITFTGNVRAKEVDPVLANNSFSETTRIK